MYILLCRQIIYGRAESFDNNIHWFSRHLPARLKLVHNFMPHSPMPTAKAHSGAPNKLLAPASAKLAPSSHFLAMYTPPFAFAQPSENVT